MEPRDHFLLLHELFGEIAHRYPERIAIDIPPASAESKRVMVTYAELNARAGKQAVALAPVAKCDGIIAILLPRNTPELYAAQLAVLKSGAAFTCIDPKFPDEHLGAVLRDAGAVAVITDSAGHARLRGLAISLPRVFDVSETVAVPEQSAMRAAAASDMAYVIYTSGTTGKPKGVMIEHRSIANLIQSDVEYFGLTCEDRVAQCSSPAYDSSIEETWLAFSVGATLVPLDDATVRLGPDLIEFLRRERITVLCPPPTLLRSTGCLNPQRELPDLKLLYVGGEALPADLADLWSAGRWLENGYGPTECTVTVTRGRICAGQGITIGKAVKGNRGFILGMDLEEVAAGDAGELCITGASLARGYHDRHDLTVEKFPEHPKFGRIYRTGDLVRQNAEGNFEYLGRIDSQVKLRGYRIELEAVEAILAAAPGVRAAACRVQGEGSGQVLAAHIIPALASDPPGFDALKEFLRRALPEYMVPGRFAFIEVFPTSAGGKLDRKSLAEIGAPARDGKNITPARNAREKSAAAAFAQALKIDTEISIDDDFFLDLGGDSLGAVAVICALRAESNGSAITVRDLYTARTIEGVARLPVSNQVLVEPPHEDDPLSRLPSWPVLSTVVQTLWLIIELVAGSAMVYAIVFEVLPWLLRDIGLLGSALLAPVLSFAAFLVYVPVSVGLVVILKRLVIGKYEAARVPVWGGFFTRHWIVTSAARLIPWSMLEGTPLISMALRALGATIGRRAHIHRGVDFRRGGWDLLTIGNDVTLGQDASVRLTELEAGQLIVGPVTIESGATLDVRAGMSPGSTMEGGAFLSALSWLPSGATIPVEELWDGVPAVHCGRAPAAATAPGRGLSPSVYTLLILLGQALRIFVSGVPAILAALLAPLFFVHANDRLLAWLNVPCLGGLALIVICVLAAAAVVTTLLFQALAMRFLGRVRPGVFAQYSQEALRIWTKTGILDSASRWLSGAMFWPWWLRLAGMRIAPGCEISTIIDTVPETVNIGAESFFADGIYFCGARRHRGSITVGQSRLGRGTFLGNHAVVPHGQEWPDGLFIGVSTPADPMHARTDTAWFGHPAIELPRREVIAADRRLTHNPNWVRYLTRLFWEVLRFALPALPIVVGYEWYVRLAAAAPHFNRAMMAFVITPLATIAAGSSMCLAIVILKWLLLGRAQPGQHAFWSCWCGRWDFLFMAWGYWGRGMLQGFEGTLLLNAFLRLTGVRIGRRVVLGAGFSQVVDPDMLIFEDDATVACHFQAHSFEDRILKLDEIRIGKGASAGENAVIFYGVDLAQNARLAPHSVVMKRDQLSADTRYSGNPSRPA